MSTSSKPPRAGSTCRNALLDHSLDCLQIFQLEAVLMKTIERHRAHATPCKQPCSHEVAQMSQHRRCHALYLQCMMSSDGRQFPGPCIQLAVNIICDGSFWLHNHQVMHSMSKFH